MAAGEFALDALLSGGIEGHGHGEIVRRLAILIRLGFKSLFFLLLPSLHHFKNDTLQCRD